MSGNATKMERDQSPAIVPIGDRVGSTERPPRYLGRYDTNPDISSFPLPRQPKFLASSFEIKSWGSDIGNPLILASLLSIYPRRTVAPAHPELALPRRDGLVQHNSVRAGQCTQSSWSGDFVSWI